MRIEFVGGPLDGIESYEVADSVETIEVNVPVHPMSDMVTEPDCGCLAAAVQRYKVRYKVERTFCMQHLSRVQKAVFKEYVRE